MVLSPSNFYKIIGDNGYKKLLNAGVIICENYREIDISGFITYDTTKRVIGKQVELEIYDILSGKSNKLLAYDVSTTTLFESLGGMGRLARTGTKSNCFDIIYGDNLIDVKAYCKKFTQKQIRSFHLQLLIYYCYNVTNKINYLCILNPLRGIILKMKISLTNKQCKKIIKIYEECKNIDIIEFAMSKNKNNCCIIL